MATIGIDLTPIQGPHRMRGVGSTVINTLRHLPRTTKNAHIFIFYVYEEGKQDALSLIDVSSFPNYEVRFVPVARPLPPSVKSLAGLSHMPQRIWNITQDRRIGTKRITDTADLDSFLQFEQDVIPPARVKSTIIAYDLIPYVLERDYLWRYSTARKLHNYSRRGALKSQIKRRLFLQKIRKSMQRASAIIAISDHTKRDFIKYVGVADEKIEVCHLGISEKIADSQSKSSPSSISRYVNTSWGDITIQTKLPDTPFLLFVGGADPRRKLADLIHAFNLLRAQGHNLHLVLAGDTMLGPNSIPNNEARQALLTSSYLDDIYMLGFIEDSKREWLYEHALTFVYPSRYEGFGLPVLEAMQYGTPVITYRNSSIEEIAGDAAIYAGDFITIAKLALDMLKDKNQRQYRSKIGAEQASKFSWSKSASHIFDRLA